MVKRYLGTGTKSPEVIIQTSTKFMSLIGILRYNFLRLYIPLTTHWLEQLKERRKSKAEGKCETIVVINQNVILICIMIANIPCKPNAVVQELGHIEVGRKKLYIGIIQAAFHQYGN